MKRLGAGLVLIALALLTFDRATVWTSDATLWTETLRQMPANPRALINAHGVMVTAEDHRMICDRLQWLEDANGLNSEEQWFTDRLCSSR